ncbi:hypothetical protein BUY57_08625 [Staphylococcus epidermidis]|uniref:hypothetical protein n=1 Tax=Staphylococcus epidermidis TaxID=1282 RepID=UPI000D1CC238|nr:hypothetical protein [Staphylococcus epidermidis]DAZ07160.1 MAG TPA: hypothetical protein [Caudoviricetes sp.]MCE5045778.1 hypothetical protein [Staphylococcus epidermidis]MCG2341672.1 hypothetical protein [Staphylococcus epidermidis]PTE62632.1 hypothetical protein BUY57_08625 [Staphylococcus epidermidis]PTE72863.1 hypothetical protein BUY50_00860 [Staphylococcus epidermidis]
MEIKYPLDENQEQYFAATHKDAVQGIDLDELENSIAELQSDNNKTNSSINELMEFRDTVIGDTGWVDFQVLPGIKKNTKGGDNSFNTGVREVRFGSIRIKSIRLNIGNVPHNVQIAQMPLGFITVNQNFYATTDGNSSPIRVSADKAGGVSIYLNGDDKNKPQKDVWIYQQFTWLE